MGVEEAASIIFDLAKGLRGNHTLKRSYTKDEYAGKSYRFLYPPKDYNVTVRLDAKNAINESKEANNDNNRIFYKSNPQAPIRDKMRHPNAYLTLKYN